MRSFLLIFLFSFTTMASFGQVATNLESVPRLVKFSGSAPKGTNTITFAIYRTQDDPAALWLETQTVTVGDDGRYSVLLGYTKPDGMPAGIFANGEARWIGVKVGDAAENERILFLSVPYALKALDAETLGGMPASAFMRANTKQEITKAQSETSAAVNTTTGSQGSIPVFTDNAGTLGNSLFFQSGNSVGMGRSPVIAGLDVLGGVRANTGLATGARNISDDAINTNALFIDGSNALGLAGTNNLVVGAGGLYTTTSIYAASQERITLNGITGNVGISNPFPSAKFDVAGVFKVDANGIVYAAGYKDQNGNPIFTITAGDGLSGGNIANTGGVAVDATVARRNVDNTFLFNQTINGQLNVGGLLIGTNGAFNSPSAGITGLAVTTDGTNASPGFNGFAIKATSSGFGTGVYSRLNGTTGTGTAVWGIADPAFGTGVRGETNGIGGFGVIGVNYGLDSNTTGIEGVAYSNLGTGMEGVNLSTTGITVGVRGRVDSSQGVAGVFFNTAGGPILEGDGLTSGVFTVGGNGLVTSKAGYKYPDGTIQTTAAAGGVTSITAGSGLSGGTVTSSGTFAVDGTVVRTSDSRLTDSRNPLAGSSFYIQNSSAPQIASMNVTGNVTAGTFTGNGQSLTGLHQLAVSSVDPTCDASSAGSVYFNSTAKSLRYCDGTQYSDFAPRLYSDGPKYCGSTSSTTGQFNSNLGYRTAKLNCQGACASSDAHMCTASELIRGSQLQATQPAVQSWYADGTTDCSGWTSTSGNANTWNGNSNSGIAACSSSLPIACCK